MHESGINHADLLGLAIEQPQHSSNDGKPNSYRNRQYNVRDTDTINQHLAYMRESHMEEDERPQLKTDSGSECKEDLSVLEVHEASSLSAWEAVSTAATLESLWDIAAKMSKVHEVDSYRSASNNSALC